MRPLHPLPQRRYGWVYEPRAGIKELLRSLTDPSAAVFLTLWSENTAGVANEEMDKLSQAINGPAAHTAPVRVVCVCGGGAVSPL